MTPELLSAIQEAGVEDKRQLPDELEYLIGLGLRLRERIRRSERRALENFA